MSEYVPPQYRSKGFNCPYCNAFAHQTWDKPTTYHEGEDILIKGMVVEVSFCSHCENATLWLDKKIIYPPQMSLPANSDLPDSVKEIYEEAAPIANQSPRAASALLRLAIEMLLKDLGEAGTINEGIKNLVKKGLDERIQQALDIVRVTGNNAVHPGKIDFDDSTDVQTLFGLINLIADALITQPKQIAEMYNQLPETAREGIKKRDGKTD